MLRHALGLAAALAVGAGASGLPAGDAAAAEFKMDSAHTDVVFNVNHLGYSNTWGSFEDVSGSFTFDPDAPAEAEVSMTIQAASIDTNHKKRDEHLRSPDFLNAKEFPTITFESTNVEITGEKQGKLTGDLTLHGQTHPVTLDVTFNKMAPHPLPQYDNVLTAGFSARGTIERAKWGVGKFTPAVGNEMTLFIEVEGMAESGE
jgi:polyisoprenoid-binding protein YceI